MTSSHTNKNQTGNRTMKEDLAGEGPKQLCPEARRKTKADNPVRIKIMAFVVHGSGRWVVADAVDGMTTAPVTTTNAGIRNGKCLIRFFLQGVDSGRLWTPEHCFSAKYKVNGMMSSLSV